MFVFISDLCKAQIQEQQISDKVLELQTWVENGDFHHFTELFEIFVHPYYVRKKVAYQYRLLARHSTVTLDEQSHGVVVFFACFARGDKAYDDFYFNPARQGDFLYNQQQLDDKLTDYVKARLNEATAPKPVMVNEALALTYLIKAKTNLLHLECPPQDTYTESRLWRYHIAPRLNDKDLDDVLTHIHTALETNQNKHFTIKNFDLVFEPLPTPTLRTPNELPSPLDRRLPNELLFDKEGWKFCQLGDTSPHLNVYLNELGKQVCDKLFGDGTEFPLLVNASALQGKSTLLALLAIHYHYQDEADAGGLPYLLLCNDFPENAFSNNQVYDLHHYFNHSREDVYKFEYNECLSLHALLRKTINDTNELPFDNSLFIDKEMFITLWQQNPTFQQAPFDALNAGLVWNILQKHIKGGFEFDGISLYPDQELFKLIYQKVWLDWYKPLCQNGYFDLHDVLVYFNENYKPTNLYKAILIDDADQWSKLELYTILKHSVYYEMPHLFYQSPIILMGNDEYNSQWQEMAMAVFKYCQKEQNSSQIIRPERLTIKEWQSDLHAFIAQKHQNSTKPTTSPNTKAPLSLNINFINSSDQDAILALLNTRGVSWYANTDISHPNQHNKSYVEISKLFEFCTNKHRIISLYDANNRDIINHKIALLGFDELITSYQHTTNKKQADFLITQLQRALARSSNEVFIIANNDEFIHWQHFFDGCHLPIRIANANTINPKYHTLIPHLKETKDKITQSAIADNDAESVIEIANQFENCFLFKDSLELRLKASEITGNYQDFFAQLTNDIQKHWAFAQLWSAKHKKAWLEHPNHCPKSLLGNLLALQITHNKPFNYTIDKAYQLAFQAYLEQYESPTFGDYWRTLITPLLELFLAKRIENFGQIDVIFRQIDEKQYYMPFLTMADIYDEYGDTERAIHYWQLSETLNTKVLPPDRYYQLKLKNTNSWKETLVPLLHLNNLGEFMNTLENNDINELTSDDWQKILPYLEEDQNLEAVLTYFLPQLTSADLLKKVLEHCEYDVSARFESRLQRLITLKACLEGDWDTVMERLAHYIPTDNESILTKLNTSNQAIQIKHTQKHPKTVTKSKFYPPQEEVVDMLYALNLNPAFKSLTDAEAFNDYMNDPLVVSVFTGIRKIFRQVDIETDDGIQAGCWNVKFPEVQALALLLEKSDRPYDMMEVYHDLATNPKNSAALRKIAKERTHFVLHKMDNILNVLTQELNKEITKTDEENELLKEFQKNKKLLAGFTKTLGKDIDTKAEYATLPELPPLKNIDEILKRILILNNQEQKEIARLQKEQERAEKERLAAIKKAEQEKLEAEKAEQKRLAKEQAEKERAEKERLEQERLEKERLEKERLEREQAEKERLEKEKLEQERLQAQKAEAERLEQERLEQEKLAQQKAEQERLEKERLEKEQPKQEDLEQAQPAYKQISTPTPSTESLHTPEPPIVVAPKSTPVPTTDKPIKPTSELNFFGWRVFVARLHKRLNLECTQTGQRLSLYWQTLEMHSDWHYHQDDNRFVLMGLPLVIDVVDDKVKLHHSEHQIDLWIG